MSDAVVQSRHGAFLGFAQVSLELRKGLFDRIEIWAVRRQVTQFGAGRLNDLAHLFALVSRQIVDDDDMAGPERWNQALLQVLDEDRPVYRAIDDEGRAEAVQSKSGHKGHRLPVPPGNATDHPATSLGPSVEARHFGRSPGLIDEDELCRIEPGLLVLPSRPRLSHVRPLLLGGVHAFF